MAWPQDRLLSLEEASSFLQEAVGKYPSIVLLAESYSTPLAIAYAATRPDALRALVLCAGFARSPLTGWRRRVIKAVAPVLFRYKPSSLTVRALLVGLRADKALVAEVRSVVEQVPPRMLTERLRWVLFCDVTDRLQCCEVPILYLRADDDRLVGAGCGDWIARNNSHVRVNGLPGPHLLLQAQAVEAARVIERFVDDTR